MRKENFVFEHDSVEYKVGEEVSGVLPHLKELRYTEQSAGCGIDEYLGIYSHGSFRVEVGELSGRRVILRIVLTNASAQTAEGIRIGSKMVDVIRIYGKECSKRGQYLIYRRGDTLLYFGIREDTVVSVYYEYDDGKE